MLFFLVAEFFEAWVDICSFAGIAQQWSISLAFDEMHGIINGPEAHIGDTMKTDFWNQKKDLKETSLTYLKAHHVRRAYHLKTSFEIQFGDGDNAENRIFVHDLAVLGAKQNWQGGDIAQIRRC